MCYNMHMILSQSTSILYYIDWIFIVILIHYDATETMLFTLFSMQPQQAKYWRNHKKEKAKSQNNP